MTPEVPYGLAVLVLLIALAVGTAKWSSLNRSLGPAPEDSRRRRARDNAHSERVNTKS